VVSKAQRERIEAEPSAQVLSGWLRKAASATRTADVFSRP